MRSILEDPGRLSAAVSFADFEGLTKFHGAPVEDVLRAFREIGFRARMSTDAAYSGFAFAGHDVPVLEGYSIYGDFSENIFKRILKKAKQATHAVDDALKSIDPTTEAGRKKLAKILPAPLDFMIASSGALIGCAKQARKANSPAKLASCIGDWLLTYFKELLESPAFQIALAVSTGNIPGAVIIGAKAVARIIVDTLKDPGVAKTFSIGKQDIEHVQIILNVLIGSPDFLLYLGKNGIDSLRQPQTYHLLGGLIGTGAPKASLAADVGWAIGYNATLFAALAGGGTTSVGGQTISATDEFQRLHVAPIERGFEDARGRRGLEAAVGIVPSLGSVIAKIGQGIKKIPLIGKRLGGIEAAGKQLQKFGSDLVRFVADLKGIKTAPPKKSAADWQAEIDKLKKERDAAKREAEALRSKGASSGGVPSGGAPKPPPSTTTTMPPVVKLAASGKSPASGGGAPPTTGGTKLAAAAAGFAVLGPIGAAAGYFLASRGGR